MSQHDYVIDNQSATAARADINAVLQAIATTNSGATSPTNTFANQLWFDTAANQLKKRNEADTAWLILGTVDDTGGTFTPNSLLTVSGIAPATLVTSGEGINNSNNDTTIPTCAAVKSLVTSSTAGLTAGSVGSYAYLQESSSTTNGYTVGNLYAGSGLLYSGVEDSGFGSLSSGPNVASGTWRAMGQSFGATGGGAVQRHSTLFLRIS